MKIELKALGSGGRHTVVVHLPIEDPQGKIETTEMRVIYRGVSLREGAAIEARATAEAQTDERAALANALAEVVVELPDLVNNGAAVEPTAEFFATLDTFYLNRINAAIREDRAGPNR